MPYYMKKQLLIATSLLFSALSAVAEPATADSARHHKVLQPVRRFYVGSGFDGLNFSSASIKNTTANNTVNGTLRFTYIINWGFTFNLNLSRHIGLYTGIDVKNIGFIEEVNGIVTKRRTYNIGAPLGFKIGNMVAKKGYFFAGGGVDVPVNYREKSFSVRNQKTKFNEWFSDRTPAVMPYVFAGIALNRGMTLKAQYYPDNFLNPQFTKNGTQPYANYDVHLEMLSIGLAVPLKRTRTGANMHMIGNRKAKRINNDAGGKE